MTGLQLLTYLKRRLAEQGLTLEADRSDELYDYLTEGRDEVLSAFSLAAPLVVQSAPVLLEQPDPVLTPQIWRIPAAAKDPYRIITIRDVESGEPFSSTGVGLEQDGGEFEWQTTRQLKVSEDIDLGGGIEVIYVAHAGDIVAATTEAQIGLPTTCHRAIGKYAAVLALTADEESDATNAMGLFQREMEKLERIYGDFDAMGGASLRGIMMHSLGQIAGDTHY